VDSGPNLAANDPSNSRASPQRHHFGTLYGIIALGVTLTFGITGIVNFALGQCMMIGATRLAT
jgi:hypothetical protein